MGRPLMLIDHQDEYSKNVHLTKAICRFSAILIEILTQFFTETERTILKLIWNNIKPRPTTTNPSNKRTYQGTHITDLKIHYRAIVKMAWYWDRERLADQWNRTEGLEMNLHTYGHLIFHKRAKSIWWKKDSIFNKWSWFYWQSACRSQIDHSYFF